MSKPMKPHHAAWLEAHPHRDGEWFRARTSDGFDVHHIDGDRNNNDPRNLVMIECSDHMMLHTQGTRCLRMSFAARRRANSPKKPTAVNATNFGVSDEKIAEWRSRSRLVTT